MRRWSSYGLRVIFTGQNQGGQLGCSSLDRNIWDGEKEIKTFATKLAKNGYLQIGVSSQRTFTLFHFFFFQPLSGVTSQYRQYLNRVRDSLTHQVFYNHVNVQIQKHFIYSHFFKVNVNIKTPIQAEDCLYLNIFRPHRDTGEISDQYLCQINIYVRSLSLSDQYLCHTNAMGMNR